MKNVFQWVFILALCIGCKKDSKQKDKDYVPVSIGTKSETTSEIDKKARKTFGALPEIAENKNNPISHEKVVLGKKLYYDKRLSKDNTQSCNTCHNLKTFGVDNLSFSIGNDGKPGGRNSPTTLNAALHISQF